MLQRENESRSNNTGGNLLLRSLLMLDNIGVSNIIKKTIEKN